MDPDLKAKLAAIKIQSVFRGFMYRSSVKLGLKKNRAAIIIQKNFRKFRARVILERLRQTISLGRIQKAVSVVKKKREIQKEINHLKKFDHILTYYPAKSINNPEALPKIPKTLTMTKRPKTALSSGRKSASSHIESSAKTAIKEVQKSSTTVRSLLASSKPKSTRKRKILVNLPPPWHEKDPKRVSQAQQDEMMFQQKNNFAWAKQDLISTLMKRADPRMKLVDDLWAKNEKFKQRKVGKLFIHLVPRAFHHLHIQSAQSITRINGSGIFAVSSLTQVNYFKIKGTIEDSHPFNYVISNIPLFDSIINPSNGNVFGIDCYWRLCFFEGPKVVLSKKLEVDMRIPVLSHFMHFDRHGMLWINLFPQRGDLICVDPLTLETHYKIIFENVVRTNPYISHCIQIIPVYVNGSILGFAGTFVDRGLMIFSFDFLQKREFIHRNLEKYSFMKQIGNKLYLWSSKRYIVVYELQPQIPLTEVCGVINVQDQILAVDGITDPDLLMVSTSAGIKLYLTKKNEVQLNYPTSKMSAQELKFAHKLLGPPEFTKSRCDFSLILIIPSSQIYNVINITKISSKLAFICMISGTGSVVSYLLAAEFFQTRAIDFDIFEFDDKEEFALQTVREFSRCFKEIEEIDAELKHKKAKAEYFDAKITEGMLSLMFSESKRKFSLIDAITNFDVRSSNAFLPPIPPKSLSVYEMFHFFMRADILPTPLISFSPFLVRFCPTKIKPESPPSRFVERPIPLITSGVYNCITDQFFTLKEVQNKIDEVNPVARLKQLASKYVISDISALTAQKMVGSKSFFVSDQIEQLNKRISKLSKLEDIVKHEILKRLLEGIYSRLLQQINLNTSAEQEAALLNRIRPQISTEMQLIKQKDVDQVDFYPTPNRNPLLEIKRHKSIYECWSNKQLFGRDNDSHNFLMKWVLPRGYFDNSAVENHFKFVTNVANSAHYISTLVYGYKTDVQNATTHIVVTQNTRALPLSHYLTIHSFLGSTQTRIYTAKIIFSKILSALRKLHSKNIICRTVVPSNIFIDSANNIIQIGTIFDCQHNMPNKISTVLPLPTDFAQPTNPFLPPEYYHKPLYEHTTAFDIWQIGVLLLYILTGNLPPSYGSELLSRLSTESEPKRVRFNNDYNLTEPPLYTDIGFFYDWMKGATVVPPTERVYGECGEIFFVSELGLPATCLDIEHYNFMPLGCKEEQEDLHKLIEVIGLCLRLDPTKRPTVTELIKFNIFNSKGPSFDMLEEYTAYPDPKVFVAQFFYPVLDNLMPSNFSFAMGIITALIFNDDMTEEDIAYSFPLGKRANLNVIACLFKNNFLDIIVKFVINNLSKEMTKENVAYGSSYNNEIFNDIFKFYDKFLKTVEHGQGPLMLYVNDVVQSLYELYACNPFMRYETSFQMLETNEYFKDSCCLFIFMHNKLYNLVLFAAQGSSYIANCIVKTQEHNDAYYEQFIPFSNNVYSLAYSVVFGNEKQKSNTIKNIVGFWNNGQSIPIVRLFVDFKVPQKIFQCVTFPSSRNDATSFLIAASKTTLTHEGSPTHTYIQQCMKSSVMLSACMIFVRDPNATDGARQPLLEVIKMISHFNSIHDATKLFISEAIPYIAENSANVLFRGSIDTIISRVSPIAIEIIMQSSYLQKIFSVFSIEYVPKVDLRVFAEELDINDNIELTKSLCSLFYLRQSTLPPEFSNQRLPLTETSKYIQYILMNIPAEGDMILKPQENKQRDDNDITKIKRSNARKEISFEYFSAKSSLLFRYIFLLFKNIMKATQNRPPTDLVAFLSSKLSEDIHRSVEAEHPSVYAHLCIRNICIYLVVRTSDLNIKTNLVNQFYHIINRDIVTLTNLTEPNMIVHMTGAYFQMKAQRIELLRAYIALVKKPTDLINNIANKILHNTTLFDVPMFNSLRDKIMYPIRIEGENMFRIIINQKTDISKQLAVAIETSNFLENERKLSDMNSNEPLVSSSLRMFNTIFSRSDLFSPHFVKQCAAMKDSFTSRFSQSLTDLTSISIIHPKREKASSRSHRSSGLKGESWKRPITTLDGKPSSLVFAPGSKPVTIIQIK